MPLLPCDTPHGYGTLPEMTRIEPIKRGDATDGARELLDELASRGGEPGQMVRAMAKAPALLRGYLDLVAGIHPAATARSAA